MPVFENIAFEGIEGIRVGRTNRALNTTCIVYRLGQTIIDTGPSNQWPYVKKFVDEREVDRVMITHHHEDHSGNGAQLKSNIDAPILMPPSGLDRMKSGFNISYAQARTWGKSKAFEAEAVPEDVAIHDGITLRSIHAPGHSHDMTCYLEPNRGWLFCGDVYIASRTKYFRFDENIHQQIDSLERCLQLDFETLLCSHRGPLADGKRRVKEKMDFLNDLRAQVLDLHHQGLPPSQISKKILGPEDKMRWMSLGKFKKFHIIQSCLDDTTQDTVKR